MLAGSLALYLYGVGRGSSVDINLLVAGSLRIVSDKILQFIFNQAEVGTDIGTYSYIDKKKMVALYLSMYLYNIYLRCMVNDVFILCMVGACQIGSGWSQSILEN